MSSPIEVYPLELSPGFVIRQLHWRLSGGLTQAFREAGLELTPEQWALLNKLWQKDGLKQSRLAELVRKDRQSVTRIVDCLERAELVRREPDPADRRSKLVRLTPEGRRLKPRMIAIVSAFLEKAFAGLDPKEISEMDRLHRHVLANLGWPIPGKEEEA